MAKLARFQKTIQTLAGDVVPNASVEITSELTGALAALYSDRVGASGILNPATADDEGFVAFYVIGGAYKVRAYTGPSGSPTFERIWRHFPIGTAAEYDANNLLFAFPIAFAASGRLGAAEALPPFNVPLPMTLEDTTGWYARVVTAPTAAKTVSVVKNGVEFASIAFGVGQTEGVITFPAETELAAGDKVWPIMPAVADSTMATFTMTILARR